MANIASPNIQIDIDQFVPPKLRKIVFRPKEFTSNRLSQWSEEHKERQHLFLKNICKKYTIQQQQQIRRKSQQQTKSSMKHLKNHLKSYVSKESIERIMNTKLNEKQDLLRNIDKTKTQVIDIGQKYRKQISLKLQMLNQAESIRSQKDSFKQWCKNKNDSPILNRMSHMLEKEKHCSQYLNKNKENSNLRASMEEQTGIYKKRRRNYAHYR